MKPLARAKERLAEVLTAGERRRLSLAMLADVVAAARALDRVWVLCSDPDAAEVAAAGGAEAREDPTRDGGLNASLAAATADAIAFGARGVLVLSADCPAVRSDDVSALALGPGVVVAPDRSGRGTNALWREPPDVIEAAFEHESLRAHVAQASAHGIPYAVVARERVGLDIDRPADLEALLALGAGEATSTVLAELGYPSRRRG